VPQEHHIQKYRGRDGVAVGVNENPGYMMMGRLYAVGYMKGLLDAI